jgi:hypothetical protein
MRPISCVVKSSDELFVDQLRSQPATIAGVSFSGAHSQALADGGEVGTSLQCLNRPRFRLCQERKCTLNSATPANR